VTRVQERRLREMRSRVLVRDFEYRQRRHARGAWFRLRRALALAKEAYVLPREGAERLLDEGYPADPVGRELEPPRTIVLVPPERAARLAGARPVAVRLTADLLGAEGLALVPFPKPPAEAPTARRRS
jgi:hypothetical protein